MGIYSIHWLQQHTAICKLRISIKYTWSVTGTQPISSTCRRFVDFHTIWSRHFFYMLHELWALKKWARNFSRSMHSEGGKRGWTQIFFMKTKIINLDFPCFQFFVHFFFFSYIFFSPHWTWWLVFSPSFFQLFFQQFSTHYPWTTQPTNISRERVGMSHPYRCWNETEKLFRDWRRKLGAVRRDTHVTWSHGCMVACAISSSQDSG